MNEVRISGFVNSDVFTTSKVQYMFLRFDKQNTVKVLTFDKDFPDLKRGDYVEVVGKLIASIYNNIDSIAIKADTVTISGRPQPSSTRKSTKSTSYKQDYGTNKYDI